MPKVCLHESGLNQIAFADMPLSAHRMLQRPGEYGFRQKVTPKLKAASNGDDDTQREEPMAVGDGPKRIDSMAKERVGKAANLNLRNAARGTAPLRLTVCT
ncbi:hypothetical protein PG997_006542 [Apiospora hydei]|uniref:Uncharacterized protein n=1 Tax=Apiospora hydei TaxID=1337664 RepID=A0ABR1WP18_9PEZI